MTMTIGSATLTYGYDGAGTIGDDDLGIGSLTNTTGIPGVTVGGVFAVSDGAKIPDYSVRILLEGDQTSSVKWTKLEVYDGATLDYTHVNSSTGTYDATENFTLFSLSALGSGPAVVIYNDWLNSVGQTRTLRFYY